MRFVQAAALLSVLSALAGVTATTPTKSTAAKKVTAKKTYSAKGKAVKSRSTKKAVPAATWRTRQQNPTPERYKEIQQALVDKGYLKGDPSGVWDSASADAMQRFQSDQKLTPTGKINAPSLIGLGLGAKSAGAPEAAPLKPEAAPGVPAPSQTEPH